MPNSRLTCVLLAFAWTHALVQPIAPLPPASHSSSRACAAHRPNSEESADASQTKRVDRAVKLLSRSFRFLLAHPAEPAADLPGASDLGPPAARLNFKAVSRTAQPVFATEQLFLNYATRPTDEWALLDEALVKRRPDGACRRPPRVLPHRLSPAPPLQVTLTSPFRSSRGSAST